MWVSPPPFLEYGVDKSSEKLILINVFQGRHQRWRWLFLQVDGCYFTCTKCKFSSNFFWKWTARILFGVIFTNNLNVALKDASVTGGEIQSHVSGRGLGYCRFRIIMSVATLPEWDRTSRELFFSTTKRRAAVFYSCSNAEGVWEDMAFLCFCPNTSLSSNLHYFWGRFLPTRR